AQAGLVLTATPILMPLLAAVSGTLSDRIGSRLLSTAGTLMIAVALLLLSRIDLQTPLAYVAGALVLLGVGSGVFSSPNMSAVLGAVLSALREPRLLASPLREVRAPVRES